MTLQEGLKYYLGTGLKLTTEDDGVFQMCGIDSIYNRVLTHNSLDVDFEDIKPLLRPLSQLTEEIEHNGERFVPIKTFAQGKDNEAWLYDYLAKGDPMALTQEHHFYILKSLFNWHFDIFGWIEQGLAQELK